MNVQSTAGVGVRWMGLMRLMRPMGLMGSDTQHIGPIRRYSQRAPQPVSLYSRFAVPNIRLQLRARPLEEVYGRDHRY